MQNNNENQNEVSTNLAVETIAQMNNLYAMVDFFVKYQPKKIQKNAKKLKFWKEVLFKDPNLMDDPEHREEFLAILDLVEQLAELSSKFTLIQLLELSEAVKGDNKLLREKIASNLIGVA